MALLRKCLQELRDRGGDDVAIEAFMSSADAKTWCLEQMSLAFSPEPRSEIEFMTIPGGGPESSYSWVLEH